MNQKVSVFFDANSYRQLVSGKNHQEIAKLISLILGAEKEKKIEPISVYTVNYELLANLVEGKSGVNYNDCLNSLRFLSNHCFDYEKHEVRVSSLPFLQVSSMIFGALPIDFNSNSKRISKHLELYRSFKQDPLESNDFYEFIKSSIQNEEKHFSNNITDLIEAAKNGINEMYPNLRSKIQKRKLITYFKSESYEQYLSEHLLRIIAENLNIVLSEDEFQKRGYFLRKELPISTAFMQWILCDVINKNIDLNSNKSKAKRWNWLWDYQISFLISKNTINNGKMLLISSDKEITQILKENNLEDNVLSVNQYLEFLGVNEQ